MTPHRPRGMTLVEMLVALAATLLLMAAVAQVFGAFGSAVSNSRTLLETDARLRSVAWKLRCDLAGATCPTLPPVRSDAGDGYFEVVEGPNTDLVAYNYYDPATNSIMPCVSGFFVKSSTSPGPGPSSDDRLLGDHDDCLLFTTRAIDSLFIGRAPTPGATTTATLDDNFQSNLAEVAWFARQTPGTLNPVTYTLYRRQLLVMGYVGTRPFAVADDCSINFAQQPYSTAAPGKKWAAFFNLPCDISVRLESNSAETRLFPNTLTDLSRREARFMHNVSGTVNAASYPFRFVNHQTPSTVPTAEVLPVALEGLIFDSTSQRSGEDVVLTNVLSFDVRVFDPVAPVAASASGNTPLVPGDPGYVTPPAAIASGCYVDLGHGVTSNSLTAASRIYPHFGGNGDPRSRLDSASEAAAGFGLRRTYDTWSTHYEGNGKDEDGNTEDTNNNGVLNAGEDQNGNGVLDQNIDDGTDGNDNDSDGKIDEPPYDANGNGTYTDAGDDAGELETAPPYPYPLRGIEIRIRCWEPSSRQVRQITVRHTFVPH